ncbi:MAG: hypothetical protein WC444_07130 [Candidatus Paceibacterota bacterium]
MNIPTTKEIEEAVAWVNHPHTGNISEKMRETLDRVFLPLATFVLEAQKEWPEERDDGCRCRGYECTCDDKLNRGFNLARSQCLAVHLRKVGELEDTIEQLRVQLAGCGVEALGYGKNNEGKQVEKGTYGYSASLQDVRDLREKYQKLKDVVAEKDRELQKYKDNTLRIICGDCSKAHNPTFEEVVNLGCAICNKEQIAKLEEEIAELHKDLHGYAYTDDENKKLKDENEQLHHQIEGLRGLLTTTKDLLGDIPGERTDELRFKIEKCLEVGR